MTGTKKDREALKNRYRKGMYPTENDFADVFESYVHKDDDIPMSKVVITDGDGKPTTLSGEIDKKADKTTLQTFIDEIETILQVVRNDKNQIASTAIDNLPSRIQAAEDDIDTAEDNISGHEIRIATLESSKTDYEAFKERVRAFLEDADASDATINRWHEIETFLQGITDTETLTGLLNDLKNEILAAIPSPQSGNFIEYTTDLDAITDAPNGKIMQYWGQSNDKYKRGQFYERVEGGTNVQIGDLVVTIQEFASATDNANLSVGSILVPTQETVTMYGNYDNPTEFTDTEIPEVGHKIFSVCYQIWNPKTISEVSGGKPPYAIKCTDNYRNVWVGNPTQFEIFIDPITNERYLNRNSIRYSAIGDNEFEDDGNNRYVFIKESDYSAVSVKKFSFAPSTQNIETSSWQHIHVDEVID
ncbi:MAG: hypothetical protein II939_01070 [Bacteroidales bacterium]|nr:hypothetical protein [Bacteroidales bacterium]